MVIVVVVVVVVLVLVIPVFLGLVFVVVFVLCLSRIVFVSFRFRRTDERRFIEISSAKILLSTHLLITIATTNVSSSPKTHGIDELTIHNK